MRFWSFLTADALVLSFHTVSTRKAALGDRAITANCFDERLRRINSTFMDTDVRSEKNRTGEEKEHPTEQTDYVPGPDAGDYKE